MISPASRSRSGRRSPHASARRAWRELKPSGGHPRGTQAAWLFWLGEAGQDAGVWQPADWHDGTIAAELESLNLPAGQEAVAVVSGEQDAERAWRRVMYAPRRKP
jgi:hypothetical protein